ncbi:DinB family protein [Bacillus sp. T33-2]|uniref:DinB family protein n=1 Tax=Bacillus sp. T33-2 TaxID=2054168 RepID=UPI000C769E4A|nr:DinB family protein [Bacillus sp. T33-2]PLR95386.1 DinB family protein [Bacillus sp. T33-2]
MLLQSLQQVRDELFASFKGLSDEQLNVKPSAERWSIAQILLHLQQSESYFVNLARQELDRESARVEEKPIAAYTDSPEKLKSPAEPSSDFKSGEELVSRLNHSRQKVNSFLNDADEKSLADKSLQHPAFGRLSLKQAIEFIGHHEKRHLRQINEVKEWLQIKTS